MDRLIWERQLRQRLKAKLQLELEQINFPWSSGFHQGFTPDQAIAYLERTHALYPELGVLPPTFESPPR